MNFNIALLSLKFLHFNILLSILNVVDPVLALYELGSFSLIGTNMHFLLLTFRKEKRTRKQTFKKKPSNRKPLDSNSFPPLFYIVDHIFKKLNDADVDHVGLMYKQWRTLVLSFK